MNGVQVAVLVKQVPNPESLILEATGRLRRADVALEMSAYCRRAVTKGVELAGASGGRCTVMTLGPPSGEAVLREALAWGADDAVLLSDPAFAGSDTLATSRVLAALLAREGPFDLILVGRSSLDAETGQVGPQLAELVDLPFAGAVRQLDLDRSAGRVRVVCEQDDGGCELEVDLPAVLAVAERLCRPAKVPEAKWAAIDPSRVRRVGADELGPGGPWGAAGSPTQVADLRATANGRAALRCSGSLDEQVTAAVAILAERGALDAGVRPPACSVPRPSARSIPTGAGPAICVLVEPGRVQVARELLGAGAELASAVGAEVVAVVAEPSDARELWSWGADLVVEVTGAGSEEDIAAVLGCWAEARSPEVVIAPATFWGREIASRLAVRLGAGLVADAIDLQLSADCRLVCAKPACGGSRLARIVTCSPTQIATVRPGFLPLPVPRGTAAAAVTRLEAGCRGRVRVVGRWRDDDVEALARAEVVVGVGVGVDPERYGDLRHLVDVLGAELAATRKVTDQGWMARSRQVGITGRSLAPRLYVAVGLSGKTNHTTGVRGAGTVLAINSDPDAPVFSESDVGIVGDWETVVPLLVARLTNRHQQRNPVPGTSLPASPSEQSVGTR